MPIKFIYIIVAINFYYNNYMLPLSMFILPMYEVYTAKEINLTLYGHDSVLNIYIYDIELKNLKCPIYYTLNSIR